MNIFKKIGINLLIATIIFSNVNVVSAKNVENYKGEYEGVHHQINFDTVNIALGINNQIKLTEKKSSSNKKNKVSKENKERMEYIMQNYSDVEEQLYDALLLDGDCEAFSYTESSVNIGEDGSWELDNKKVNEESIINIAGAAQSASGKKSKGCKSNLIFYTFVIRIGSADKDGKYTYECYSSADWSSNSFLGGEKYPASGYDFILQSVPSNYSMYSDMLSVGYTKGHKAVEGTDYVRCDGGDDYVQYKVKDDPLGLSQMDYCMLVSTCKAKPKNGRHISSYYIHTWKSLSIDVSASVDSEKNTSLDIDPSIDDKSCQIYSYVTFDF